MEKSVNINKLNGLNFPAEYIQDHGREEVIVTGKKTFEGFLGKALSWKFSLTQA